ncbi:MAG: hypothetical protein AAGA81_13265 [Acidobacteriota bacterium]
MTPVTATPLIREFLADALTPLGVYQRLAGVSKFRFLFESVTGGEQVSRFSLLGAGPAEVVLLYLDRLEVLDPRADSLADAVRVEGAPIEELRRKLSAVHSEHSDLPFTGGWVGYFGWDLIRLLEELPNQPSNPFDLPVALLARYDDVIVFDHAQQRVVLVANEIAGLRSASEARTALDSLGELLTGRDSSGAVEVPSELPAPAATREPTLTDEQYGRGVEAIKE